MTGWRLHLTQGLLLAGAAAIALAATAGKLPLPTWADALIVAIGALAALLLGTIQKHLAETLEQPGREHNALAAHTRMHDRRSRLRKVCDSTDPLALGVAPATHHLSPNARHNRSLTDVPPAYVRRDAEDTDEVARAFTHGGLLIIEGASAAGKTRMAYETMHRLAPDRWLIVPDNPTSLRALKEAGVRLSNAIIWLDDINDYLAADGLDASMLDALCPPGTHDVLMLATLRAEARRDLDTPDIDSTITRAVQSVFNRARIVLLDRALTPTEHRRAEAQRATDPRIAAALDQNTGAGFAEYLAAAPAILHRWQSARNGQNHTAGAIIDAAIDARRAGYLSPLPRNLIHDLHIHYLDPRQANQPGTPGFDDALAWAAQPVKGASSCLLPLNANTYEVFDYLIDYALATTAEDIPQPIWPILLRNAHPDDLPSLSFAAWHTGRLDIAEAAYRQASTTDHPVPMYNLALLLSRTGRRDQAEEWYRKAATASYPPAMNDLANLLRESERAQEAEEWYRKAADTGYPDAMYNLGNFLRETNRGQEAERWYRKATDTGHTLATNNMGILLRELNRDEEAEHWYRKAADAGLLMCMHNLAVLLHDTGRSKEAQHWSRKAAEAGYTDSMVSLGDLLREAGHIEEAEHWYRNAIHGGHPTAAISLGALFYEAGRTEEAEHWYRETAATGNTLAITNLGSLLHLSGRHDEAERWLREAARIGYTRAHFALGNLLQDKGQDDEAEHWWRQAAHNGHARAMNNLAVLLNRTGRAEEAEEWYRKSAETGHPSAINNLGCLLSQSGRKEEAEHWLRKAADTGHPEPMYNLADFLRETGREKEADTWHHKATNAENTPASQNNKQTN